MRRRNLKLTLQNPTQIVYFFVGWCQAHPRSVAQRRARRLQQLPEHRESSGQDLGTPAVWETERPSRGWGHSPPSGAADAGDGVQVRGHGLPEVPQRNVFRYTQIQHSLNLSGLSIKLS